LSKDKNDLIIELLHELVKWTKFQAWGKVKDVLLGVLNNDEQKKIYHLSDGINSSRKIAEKVSAGHSTIVKYWNEWANFNIVEPIPVKGGGLRYKKMFNLEDFGIEIPKISQK
jgi:hypothetical protein